MTEAQGTRDTLPYPGRSLDPELEHIPLIYYMEQNGRIDSWWPSTFPVLASMPFAWLGNYGLYFIPIASTLAVSGLILLLVRGSRRGAAAFALCALATPLAFYSFTFWEHTLAALLATIAFAVSAARRQRRDCLHSGLAGAGIALATWIRIEAVLGLPTLALSMLVWRKRPIAGNLLVLVATFGILVAPMAVAPDGDSSYLDRHYRLSQRLQELEARGFRPSALDLAVGSAIHGGVELSDCWRLVGAAAGLVAFVAPLWFRMRIGWLAWAGTGALALVCLRALLIATPYVSVHGLLLVAPFTVLIGWPLSVRGWKIASWSTLATSGIVVFGLASALLGWEGQGGLQWGPRYALVFVPAIVVATFEALERLRAEPSFPTRFLVLSFVTLYAAGLAFQLRGIHSLLYAKRTFASWQHQIDGLPQDALLVTTSPVLALCLPEIYRSRVLLRVDELDPLSPGLVSRARAAGFGKVCHLKGFEVGDLVASCWPLESK